MEGTDLSHSPKSLSQDLVCGQHFIFICYYYINDRGTSPGGSDGKASAYNVVDLGSNPGLGRSPGEGAWWADSPWGRRVSDMTEQLHFLSFHYINDNDRSWLCFCSREA